MAATDDRPPIDTAAPGPRAGQGAGQSAGQGGGGGRPPRRLWGRLWHVLFEAVAALLLLALLVVAFGVWRLSRGPLSVSWLTPYLEAAANAQGGPQLHIGDTRLAWVQEPVLPVIDVAPTTVNGRPAPARHHGSLEVVGVDVSVRAPDGAQIANLPELRATFSVPALLKRHLVPTRISLVGPRLNAVRDADGRLRLALALDDADSGDTGFFDDLLAALRQPPDPSRPLGALSRVAVRDAQVVMDDRKAGHQWVARNVDLFLAHDAQGIRGAGALALDLGDGRQATLDARLRYTLADGTSALSVRFDNLNPADFARLWPDTPPAPVPAAPPPPPDKKARHGKGAAAAPAPAPPPVPVLTPASLLAGLALPLQGAATVTLDRDVKPVAADLTLSSANATIMVPGRLKAPLPLRALDLQAHFEPGRLELRRLALDLGGPSVVVQATATRPDPAGAYEVSLSAEFKALALATLDRYWPLGVAPNPRAWILQNLSDGAFDRIGVQMTAGVPGDLSDLVPRQIHADFAFSGVTVTYMDGLPPVRAVGGGAVYDGGRLTLTLDRGHLPDAKLGDLKLTQGKLTFTGLEARDQNLDIDVGLAGPLSAALGVIDHPPLGYAAKVGLRPDAVAGRAEVGLKFNFPLLATLRMDQVKLGVTAALAGVGIDHVVGSIDAADGKLDLSLDNHGMDVTGTATLNGMPSHLVWRENFDDKAPLATRLAVQAQANDADRRRFKLDFPDWVRGPVGVDLVYAKENQTKDGQRKETLAADLDLTGAGLAVPLLDWRKVPGTPATGRLEAVFDHGQPLHFTHFQLRSLGVDGVVDLQAAGAAELWPDTYGLRHLTVERFQQGRTDARLTLDADPDGAMRVDARGPSLDARGIRRQAQAGRPQSAAARQAQAALDDKRPPLDVAFDFARVVTGDEDRQVQQAHGRMERRGRFWRRVELDALVGTVAPPPAPPTKKGAAPPPAPAAPLPPARLTVRYVPDGDVMTLALDAQDAGAALRAAGILEHVRGGVLSVRGRSAPGDAAEVVHGTMSMENFQVVDAPVLARLLSAASFQGLSDFVSGAPIGFTQFTGGFRWTNTGIDFRDVHTSGSAIGLTLEGPVNIQAGTADLQGTIVPFSSVNKVLDSIPLIGSLLSGGEGQGLLSATYHISGPLDDLDISVNPLAVLAPGFLRNLFFLPTPEQTKADDTQGDDPAAPATTSPPNKTRKRPAGTPGGS